MLATVVVTVATSDQRPATSDLAAGVVVGVPLSGVFFAFKVMSMMAVTSAYNETIGIRTYSVTS
jgi:SulP family sulfate permease